MTLGASIYAHLCANAAVSAIAGTRIRPVGLPESDIDAHFEAAVVFTLLAWEHDYDLPGNRQLDRKRYEFQCLSEDYDQAHELMEAVIAALNHFRGVMGGDGGVTVKSCILQDARDDINPDLISRGIYGATAEFEITT